MATDDSSLLKELECSICCEEYREPVIAGGCNHSFCMNCLRRYIEKKARCGEFLCPLCRELCTVPASGISGLGKNFTLENIIRKYNDVRKGLNQIKWDKCTFCADSDKKVSSSLACLQCDSISLCKDCGLEHANHPKTGNHVVVSLCELHGKPLSQFCKSCSRAICVVCFGKHSNSIDHDVVDYKDVIKIDKEDIEIIAKKAEQKTGQLTKQVIELERLMIARNDKIDDARKNAVEHFTAGKKKYEENIAYYTECAEYHRVQTELMNQKKDENTYQSTRIQELEEQFLNHLAKDHLMNTDEIKDAIWSTTTIQEDIREGMEQSDALISEKLLTDNLHDEITKTKTELQELTVASETDRVATLQEWMKTGGGLSEEYVATAGQFSSASLSIELKFSEGRFSVWGVSCMSSERIAGAVWSAGSFRILLWNLPYLAPEEIAKDDVAIIYIAALGHDKLVVLRRVSPILKVIDVVTGTTRDIDVKLPKVAIEKLWSVEVAYRGHFLVTYKDTNMKHHIILTDNEGVLIQDIEVDHVYRPTLCRMTGVITICTNLTDTVSCYHLNDNSLDEVLSVHHGVDGFHCNDICSSSLGEIFIVGRMTGEPPREIRLYQLDIDLDNKTVSMKRIDINDIDIRSNDVPRCSVNGDCLVIGHYNTVQVLKLSA
ncbi:E3 ubiquitin-protein ligase Midline-1-like [Lineus longissimus]|uniref:E3 ubiquitin-protein ligase Midline-1-like n=1 Tax=Lineus longissimus TaxID=88925 RepID=UPI00315C9B9A